MNQYEVLYAVKDYDDADQFFADFGEAPHFWQSAWHFESMQVIANNMSDVQKNFYRRVEADDGRECVFVKAQLIKKLQWVHPVVVAVKVNPKPNGWRVRTISVKTNSETSGLVEIWDLALQELHKRYPDLSSMNFVFLDRGKPEECLNVED